MPSPRPRVALVLGAGGLKCLAGIALFELLEELSIRTVLLATDMETFEPVALERGSLVDTVYASSALPPLLPPVRLGGRLLADAFYSATLPVLEAVKRDVDVVIALSTARPPATVTMSTPRARQEGGCRRCRRRREASSPSASSR